MKTFGRVFSIAVMGALAACQSTAPMPAPAPSAQAVATGPIATAAPAKTAAPVAVAQPAPGYETDRVVLSLQPGVTSAQLLANPAAKVGTLLNEYTLGNHQVVVVKLASGEPLMAARERLAGVTGVQATYLDTISTPDLVPTTEFYAQQWPHKPGFANTEALWDRLKKENIDQSKVVLADVDTGVDSDHPAFAHRMMTGYQPTTYARNPAMQLEPDTPAYSGDRFGHGTFTAGIAAANGADPNASAVAGVAWGIWIMPIKVDHEYQTNPGDNSSRHWGTFDLSDVVAGIQYVCDHNTPTPAFAADQSNGAMVRVINMSLGSSTMGVEPLYVEAVAYARSKGILCVAATGNSGEDLIPPPANTPGVLAVGSTSHYLDKEYLSVFSNYGSRIDLVAPGDAIYSTIPMNSQSELGSRSGDQDLRGYAWASGTSEAAPFVSGVAALMFAKYDPNNASLKTGNPDDAAKMVDSVRAALLKGCDDLGPPGWDPGYGWGRINADKAMGQAAPLPAGTAPQY